MVRYTVGSEPVTPNLTSTTHNDPISDLRYYPFSIRIFLRPRSWRGVVLETCLRARDDASCIRRHDDVLLGVHSSHFAYICANVSVIRSLRIRRQWLRWLKCIYNSYIYIYWVYLLVLVTYIYLCFHRQRCIINVKHGRRSNK